MLFMNEYDLSYARRRFTQASKPNRLALVMVVDQLRHWADSNSDGWAYWPAPRLSARKAMVLVQSTTNAANDRQEETDATDAEVRAAVAPIKAFLTREKVPPHHREIILRAVL